MEGRVVAMQRAGYLGIMRADRWIAAGLVAVCGAVYVGTLCPTVYVEGTGELISAAHFLGIAHPPGYPLFCLVARLFSVLVPVGSVAYRINLASAAFGALAVGVLYLLLRRLTDHRCAALAASLCFGLSRTFWSQAVIAEVYTLNALFLAVLLLLLVLWRETGEDRYLLLAAFGYGLSLTNHLTMALFGPGMLVFVLMGRPDARAVKLLSLMAFLFLLGLTPYLYLPLRAAMQPTFAWTELETFRDVLTHVTGRLYRSYVFAFPWRLALSRNLVEYLKILSRQFSIYLVWAPVLGLLAGVRRDRRMLLVLGVPFLLYVVYGITYDMDLPEVEVFYIPSFLVAALWFGSGLDLLIRLAARRLPVRVLVAVLPPALLLVANGPVNDLGRNRIPYEYGMDILNELDRDAVLFTEGDDASFILDYLRLVEQVRPDVSVYHRSGEVSAALYGPDFHRLPPLSRARRRREQETRLIAGGRRPVYYVFRAGVSLPPGYALTPEGLCYRALRAPGTPNGTFWERRDPDRLAAFPVYKDGWVRKLIANYYFARAEFSVAVGDSARGFEDYDKAGEIAFDAWVVHYNLASVYRAAGRSGRTREALARAVSLNPLMPDIYYRLGLVCSEQGEYEAAQTWWRRALQVDPGYRAAQEGLRALHSMGER